MIESILAQLDGKILSQSLVVADVVVTAALVIVTVELAYGFNAEDAPTLLRPVRAAGRAALLG